MNLRAQTHSLFLLSFLVLFLELTLIRWLPANVFALGYFQNIVLIAAFFGLGLGALLAGRKSLFRWFPLILSGFAVFVLLLRSVRLVVASPGGEWLWTNYYPGNRLGDLPIHLDILVVITLVYIVTAGLFCILGQRTGELMKGLEPLRAYGTTLLGSLCGVVAFGLCVLVGGFLGTPAAWLAIVILVLLWLVREDYVARGFSIICLIVVVGIAFQVSSGEIWSPYYAIEKAPTGTPGATTIFVNRFGHQVMIDFNWSPKLADKYLFPYYFKKPDNLLILGAGSGNDVAIAEMANVEHIDAVEIDPAIARIGREENPMHPYQNDNVDLFIDDARSFLKKNHKTYDMILLGTLDSHALLSAMSNVRLDNFIYTKESLEDIKAHLAPDGVAVLLFSAPDSDFEKHLLSLAFTTFGDMPAAAYRGDNILFNMVFVAGPGLDTSLLHDEVSVRGNAHFERIAEEPPVSDAIPTDNWPYLYLYKKAIPTHYLKAIALLLLISCGAIFALTKNTRKLVSKRGLNLFLLGAALLLVETKTITSLSLLFGSTWVVNTFVFLAILLMLYAANALLTRFEVKNQHVIYSLIILALALNFFLPAQAFLGLSFWPRALLASFLAVLPIFFAALAFSASFKKVPKEYVATMYGVNLAGAVLGGFLEYSSMVFGLKALYFVAAIFYLAAWAILPGERDDSLV